MQSTRGAEPVHTRFVELIFPEQAVHDGALFGGAALSLMSKAVFIAARRHVHRSVVMASSDETDSHSPVSAGELLELDAHLVRIGCTSMTAEVVAGRATPIAPERPRDPSNNDAQGASAE